MYSLILIKNNSIAFERRMTDSITHHSHDKQLYSIYIVYLIHIDHF